MVDLFESPEWKAYRREIIEELVPMIDESAVTVATVPSDSMKINVDFAVQLGFMIMLDKPIVAIVEPGSKVPRKLAQVADEIIEGSPGASGFEERFKAAMNRITAKLDG